MSRWVAMLPGETQAELVDRRGREAEARLAEHMAAIERHRAAGTLIRVPWAPAGYSGDVGRWGGRVGKR